MIARQKDYKKSFMSAVAGMLLVALCCFTPLLVIVLSLVAYRRWHQSQRGVSSRHES
jgi:hypothetical protein